MFGKISVTMMTMAAILSLVLIANTNSTFAVKCEDIKGTMKWGGESHGDNEASEKKFEKMVWDDDGDKVFTICELAKCYDHVECKGQIDRDDWNKFKDTTIYMGTSEDVQKCLKHRMDLGGELVDYEIHHCAVGSY